MLSQVYALPPGKLGVSRHMRISMTIASSEAMGSFSGVREEQSYHTTSVKELRSDWS
jgi:hypothetical protein